MAVYSAPGGGEREEDGIENREMYKSLPTLFDSGQHQLNAHVSLAWRSRDTAEKEVQTDFLLSLIGVALSWHLPTCVTYTARQGELHCATPRPIDRSGSLG